MLIYIHVPFCRIRCSYCAFHSTALGRGINPRTSERLQAYADTLLMELAHWGDRFGGTPVESVFFGGGTPSLLSPSFIHAVLDRIGRYFSLHPKAEITLEANPESLRTQQDVADFLAAGVNRLSIGLQSLDDNTLRMLGRAHKASDSLHTVFNAREAGCSNVSVDLMWGLPGQSMRQWLQTLKDICRIGPDHISAYGLTLEPGTPLELECSEGRLSLPPERDQNIMFSEGAAFLESNGYLHYEISNLAKPGFEAVHNSNYWRNVPYIGLGASAHSYLGDERSWNTDRIADYLKDAAGTKCREVLTVADHYHEYVMTALRTSWGVEKQKLSEFPENLQREFGQKVKAEISAGNLIETEDSYIVAETRRLLTDRIACEFF